MTDAQRQALIEGLERWTKEMVAAGPEACRRYLIELGTHNEDGTLTKEFGGEYTGEKT